MTLPSQAPKLTKNELESIRIALKDVGLTAIHPEKMEAYTQNMVEHLRSKPLALYQTKNLFSDDQ